MQSWFTNGKSEIRIFASEAFGFLLRRVKDPRPIFNHVYSLLSTGESFESASICLFESLKVGHFNLARQEYFSF
jgi:hypothetical protein